MSTSTIDSQLTPPNDANHWINMDPNLSLQDPSLVALVAYWNEKRGARRMPAREDIDPLELRSHLGRLHFIDVEYDPYRLRYRLIGTTTTETLERDMTGRYFDEIYPPEILSDAVAAFRWISAHKSPLRLFGNAHYPNKSVYKYEIVNLPLSPDDTRVNMVLGELVFRLRDSD